MRLKEPVVATMIREFEAESETILEARTWLASSCCWPGRPSTAGRWLPVAEKSWLRILFTSSGSAYLSRTTQIFSPSDSMSSSLTR